MPTDEQQRPATGPVSGRPRRPRWASALGWAGSAVATAFVLLIGAGYLLYVTPPVETVASVDVIYVIGPPTDDRLELAEQLRDAGVADELVVIGYADGNGEYEVSEMTICREAAVTCAIPDPSTTKGEALILDQYAAEHGIETAVVITVGFHIARTRYIFDRCSDVDATVMGTPSRLNLAGWAHQYAYQYAAFVKAIFTPCAGD